MLEWDGAFFGFPVARLSEALRERAGLAAALADARQRGVRLAYWSPEARESSASLARELAGTIAGTQLRYQRTFTPVGQEPAAPGVEIRRCDAPTPELESLATAAGVLSRFAVDPAMPPGTMQKMYALWLRRSFSGEMGDEVLAARDAAGPSGLVTLKYGVSEAEVGLLAVAPRARGAGVGRALMQAAALRLLSRGLLTSIVTTQGENRPACRLYEGCGYAPGPARLAVHFWL